MADQDRLFFISHSVKDAAAANWIVEGLERAGVKCWIAPRDSPEGHAYDAEIADALGRATDVVVLISDNSNESAAVGNEVALAVGRGKRVVPVRLQEVEPAGALAYHLARVQRIDYFADAEAALQELAEAAQRVAPKPKRPAPKFAGQGVVFPPGERPMTRPGATYASLLLGALLGLVGGVANIDYAQSGPMREIGGFVFIGLILFAPMLMLSRWIVANGDRRFGVNPRAYFDRGFLIVLAPAAAIGLATLAMPRNFEDSAPQSPGAIAIVVALLVLPFVSLLYLAVRTFTAGARQPVQRPVGVQPTPFERFALWGVLGAVALASAPFFGPTAVEEAPADAAAEQTATYGLSERQIAVETPWNLSRLAIDAVGVEALRQGAEGGDALGQALLCVAHESGQGVAQDDELALTWCRRAAAQDDALGRYMLALFTLEGRFDIAQDIPAGVAELVAMAEAGDARAQSHVGLDTLKGINGFEQNDETALYWLRQAAQAGVHDAQFSLAWMYENGRGVPQDYATALLWYQRLADEGSTMGKRAVGWMHLNGFGTPQDRATAFTFLKAAADEGDASAAGMLGQMYRDGAGVEADPNAALFYFNRASEGGLDRGADIDRLRAEGATPIEPAVTEPAP